MKTLQDSLTLPNPKTLKSCFKDCTETGIQSRRASSLNNNISILISKSCNKSFCCRFLQSFCASSVMQNNSEEKDHQKLNGAMHSFREASLNKTELSVVHNKAFSLHQRERKQTNSYINCDARISSHQQSYNIVHCKWMV